VKRWKRFALLFLVAIATLAPSAAVVGFAMYTAYLERTIKNPDDEQFKCYSGVFELTMASADEGWAAGYGQDVLHYQSGALRWEPGGGSKFVASSPHDVWALGGDIWHYQGKNWTRSADSPTHIQYFSQVALVSSTDTWAVGDDWVSEYDANGVIWHFDGVHWPRTQTILGLSLQGVSMTSADDGWAVGTHYAAGNPQASAFLRYQNGLWSTVASPEGLLSAVAMTSPIDGWASGRTISGEGAIYHYDGTKWQATDSLPNVRIYQISMQSASAGWALGNDYSSSDDESALFRFADGAWTRVTIPADMALYALSSLSPGDAWFVGATRTKDHDGYVHAILLHYLNGNWQTIGVPRRPATSPDAIPLRYLFETMFGSYVLVLSAWLILFARRRARRPISNEKVRRVFIAWLVVLLAVFLALAAASFFAADVLEAIPWYIVAGGLALLISFPAAYLALPMFLPVKQAPSDGGVQHE
jgi:hypothetical protein